MEARIQEAKAVLPLYEAEISRLQAVLASGGNIPPYSQATYLQFQATLQPVLDALATANGRSTFANGDTSGFCNVTPNPKATSCMRASTVTHETIHQAICTATSPWWQSVFYGTWQQQIGLIGAYQNEIAAYKAEINFLEGQLQSARQLCATGWRGEVTRTLIVQSNENDSSAGRSTTSTWDQTQVDRWTVEGEDQPLPRLISRATWSGRIDGKRSNIETTSFPLGGRCTGTVLRSHNSITNSIEGSGAGKALASVLFHNGIAQIVVNVDPNIVGPDKNEIRTTGTGDSWRDVYEQKGYCGHHKESTTFTLGAPGIERYEQPSVSVESKVDPGDPDLLSGTQTDIKQISKMSSTTLTTTWSLHREKRAN